MTFRVRHFLSVYFFSLMNCYQESKIIYSGVLAHWINTKHSRPLTSLTVNQLWCADQLVTGHQLGLTANIGRERIYSSSLVRNSSLVIGCPWTHAGFLTTYSTYICHTREQTLSASTLQFFPPKSTKYQTVKKTFNSSNYYIDFTASKYCKNLTFHSS